MCVEQQLGVTYETQIPLSASQRVSLNRERYMVCRIFTFRFFLDGVRVFFLYVGVFFFSVVLNNV